jgi:hypothetical protein
MPAANTAAPLKREQAPAKPYDRKSAAPERCPHCRKPLPAPLGAAILAAGPL